MCSEQSLPDDVPVQTCLTVYCVRPRRSLPHVPRKILPELGPRTLEGRMVYIIYEILILKESWIKFTSNMHRSLHQS